MGYEKRYLFRFFLLHLCLILPVVAVSLLAVNIVAAEAGALERQEARDQLGDALAGFAMDCQDYRDESVLLAYRQELKKKYISTEPADTAKGINTLKLKQYFDKRIRDVFVYYDTGYVYSSLGVSRNYVHFASVMGCREESVRRGIEAMESGEDSLLFLFESDTTGYLLCSYHVQLSNQGRISVNFAVPFEQIKRTFGQLQEGQMYLLEASDGSTLRLFRDGRGKMAVLDKEEWDEILGADRYAEQEETLEQYGFTARLYYREMPMGGGLGKMQTVNIILIIVGILASGAVSWRFSRRQAGDVMELENVARGNGAGLSDKSVYNRLQTLIQSNLTQSKELGIRVDRYETLLRDRAAQMIFHGLSKNTADIEATFQELGLKGCPQRFFVGALHVNGKLEEPYLPPGLRECLVMHVAQESGDMVIFLYELKREDGNQMRRREIAGQIRTCLHGREVRGVRIGMSRVYTDLLMIDSACNEAVSVLEYILSGQCQDFYSCFENVVRDISFVLPEEDTLQNFAESLQEQDLEEAGKYFDQLLKEISAQECTEENKIYVRYRILQCLVEYLQEESTMDNTALLKECLNINTAEEKEFLRGVTNVLKRCLVKKERDHFTRMLDYIESHYCRSNLTYEEVAAAGGVGKTYVSKLFRARLGMSYIEYLTSVRMDRACSLLRTTDFSVQDIVRMVGYENASSFRRCFKERYEISAVEYRKRERALR